MFPNRKEYIYTCDSHCPFVRGLKARHGINGFYDELFIFKFLDLVWGGHEKVWNLVMVFEFFLKTNMGWGQMGEHHVIFFSLINFRLKGGLAKMKVGWVFLFLPLLWVGQQWEGMVIHIYIYNF